MEGHFKYETSKEIYLIYNNSNSHQWPSNTALDSEYTSSLHILSSYNNNNSYFDFDYDSYFKGTDSLAGAAPTLVPDANQAQEAHTTSSRPDELLVNSHFNNYWALLALILVIGTAAGNILVCLAIAWERRLQNVTNYFLMSLAITDLMVAVLVMPLGILTLVKGKSLEITLLVTNERVCLVPSLTQFNYLSTYIEGENTRIFNCLPLDLLT